MIRSPMPCPTRVNKAHAVKHQQVDIGTVIHLQVDTSARMAYCVVNPSARCGIGWWQCLLSSSPRQLQVHVDADGTARISVHQLESPISSAPGAHWR
jgi:hypothetical protein